MSSRPKNKDEYRQRLADAFAHVLEEQGLEWKKEWSGTGASGAPYNAVTKAKYRGSNAFYLMILSMAQGYHDPRWVTMVQIMDTKGKYHAGQKWHLKAGTEAVWVEYWYPYDLVNKRAVTWPQYRAALQKDGRSEDEFRLSTNYYAVYNASQVEGMPPLELTVEQNYEVEPDTLIARLSQNMGVPVLNDGGDRAFYRPSEDAVHLPVPEAFESSYAYNATALHELAHSTGHPSRLNRDQSGGFGTKAYAYEELVAEMASCFMGAGLAAQASQRHIENHKAYVQGWIRDIREKPETLIRAIKDAQRATDYMDYKAELITEQEYEQKWQTLAAASAAPQQTRQGMASEQMLRREEAPRKEPGISFIPFSELTEAQRSMAEDPDSFVRMRAAQRGYALDRLVNDPDPSVRASVADQGYGLDRLIDDPEWVVRAAVADQGYGLDRLVADPNPSVRAAVARQGHSLDRLVADPTPGVRAVVAGRGYGLDRLIDDPEWVVRAAVANQGYGLNRLIDDPEWVVREAVADQGYGLNRLIDDPKRVVRAAVAAQGYGLDRLVDDPSLSVRAAVADQGYGLDRLIDDPKRVVRAAVAAQGYGLDRLVDDPAPSVRAVVAGRGYGLDRLIDDPEWVVRAAVARQGHGLDRLVADPNPSVRTAVVAQGYGLDRLVDDPDKAIAEAAREKLAAERQEEIQAQALEAGVVQLHGFVHDDAAFYADVTVDGQARRPMMRDQGGQLYFVVQAGEKRIRYELGVKQSEAYRQYELSVLGTQMEQTLSEPQQADPSVLIEPSPERVSYSVQLKNPRTGQLETYTTVAADEQELERGLELFRLSGYTVVSAQRKEPESAALTKAGMEISIYQINMQRGARNAFLSMQSLDRLLGSTEIRSQIYDCVYSGEVPCKNLEDVFAMFNQRHPEGYTGRSLSVSDVVQVRSGGDGVKPGFYFCDSVDFKEIGFDPGQIPVQRDLEQPSRTEPEMAR